MSPIFSNPSVWQHGLRLAEHSVCLQADDPQLAQKLIAESHGYCLEPASLPTQDKSVPIIQCFWHEPPPPMPIATPTAAPPLELAHGECTVVDDDCYLRIEDIHLRVRAARHAPIQLFAPPNAWRANRFALGAVFVHALHAALRRCNGFELHAAGLVNPINDLGVLVIGPSGSGKSTLAVRLAEQGWQYLSDDSVVLGNCGTMICARPLRRMLALTPTTAAACRLPRHVVPASQTPSGELIKYLVEPEQLFNAPPTRLCLPGHLVFPKLTGQPTSALIPLTKTVAITKLLRQSPWSLYDQLTARAHIATITLLAQQARAWELLAGQDLLTEPTCAARLFCTQLQ